MRALDSGASPETAPAAIKYVMRDPRARFLEALGLGKLARPQLRPQESPDERDRRKWVESVLRH